MTLSKSLDREKQYQTFLEANVQANEFARTGLASLLLLNGGAIIALAPIGSMLKVPVDQSRTAIVLVLFSFVLGLVSSVVSYLMGFFANAELAHMMQYRMADYGDKDVEQSRLKYNKIRGRGIVAAICGIGLFVIGCCISAYVLLSY